MGLEAGTYALHSRHNSTEPLSTGIHLIFHSADSSIHI